MAPYCKYADLLKPRTTRVAVNFNKDLSFVLVPDMVWETQYLGLLHMMLLFEHVPFQNCFFVWI